MTHEGEHDFFEFAWRHLAVSYDDAGIGDEVLEFLGYQVDRLDTVVDEVDLAITVEFANDGVFDAFAVEGDDFGDDGSAVDGGGGE